MTGWMGIMAPCVTTAGICTTIVATSVSIAEISTVIVATKHKIKRAPERGPFLLLSITLFFLEHLRHRRPDLRRCLHNGDPTFGHDLHLGSSSIVRTADDSTRMTHPASGRRGLSGNEPNYGFAVVFLDPACGLGFHATADFTDHHDAFRFRIVHQQLHRFLRRCTDNGITPDTYRRRDTQTGFGYLVRRLIGQRSRLAHDADLAFLENEAGHDPYLAFTRRDDTGTVRPDEPGIPTLQVILSPYHILYRDAFRDTDHQRDPRFRRFHDRIGSKSRWNKDDRHIRPGGLNR